MAYLTLRIIAASLAFSSCASFQLPSHTATHGRTRQGTGLFSTVARSLPEGISKTVTSEGVGRLVRAGDVVVAKFVCSAADSDSSFARSERQRIVVGDGSMIPGWDMAIRTMAEGERASILISDPQFGYGDAGVPGFVPSNAQIEIDLTVLDVEENAGFGIAAGNGGDADLGAMGMDGPLNRPNTPGAIAAAYEQRMKEKAMDEPEELEGVEYWVAKIKGFYFFGLFEGETGQEAPWYLKPSITFPIAFLVVAAAFAVSVLGGAISERGMPTTDELDEIILSAGSVLVFALNMFTPA